MLRTMRFFCFRNTRPTPLSSARFNISRVLWALNRTHTRARQADDCLVAADPDLGRSLYHTLDIDDCRRGYLLANSRRELSECGHGGGCSSGASRCSFKVSVSTTHPSETAIWKLFRSDIPSVERRKSDRCCFGDSCPFCCSTHPSRNHGVFPRWGGICGYETEQQAKNREPHLGGGI